MYIAIYQFSGIIGKLFDGKVFQQAFMLPGDK